MKVRKFLRKYYLEILLISPLVLYTFYFTLVPIVQTILLSFQDATSQQFTLENYAYLWRKRHFREAFVNTISITMLGLTMQMSVGLVLALILKKKFKGKGIFRSIILTPMGVPTLVSGVAMMYIFGTSGYFNELIFRITESMKYIGFLEEAFRFVPINWSGGGFRTIFLIAFSDMWKVTPIVTLLLLAGLESIPAEVYEASKIDGARKRLLYEFFRSVKHSSETSFFFWGIADNALHIYIFKV